ncbi:FxLD family lantipeptide [Catenulispora sp. MAP5-51]|uniref:FxLD family lanthipeptide n=1 Tax=Catenulispora sp. MAP5-51 TaxID=3156298 RepID=UPI003512DF66
MSPPTADTVLDRTTAGTHAETEVDPFDFDITFIQNTPASENALMCGTGDTCGSTCGSACTTS